MQPKLDKQERLYYKNKVSDIISSYEKQKQEEDRQKVLLKKQIMLTIINNRKGNTEKEKSVSSKDSKTVKTNQSEEPLHEDSFKYNQPSVKSNLFNQQHPNPDVRFESQESKQPERIEEITFNAKKRNKSLEEELTFKESYLNLLRQRRQKEQEEEHQNVEENYSSKYNSNNSPPIQRSLYKSSHSSEEEEEEQPPSEEEEKPSKASLLQKFSRLKESLQKSEAYQSNNYKQQEEEEEHYREEEEEDAVIEKEKEKKEEAKGVFLTMEESESMVADDPPKNCAFQIKLDKSADPEDLEQLKKQRIREIEKKRQERIEQFRRNESQKKVEMPKGKNSYSKRPEKDQLNQSDTPPPRSATIERKNNPTSNPPIQTHKNQSSKPERQNYPKTIPVDSHESQYSIRPASSKQLPNPSYHENQSKPSYKYARPPTNYEEREKPLSPFRTPKSMLGENRGKSNGKNTNIFTIQNEGREKSSNKEPKIEPKDRKNSFTRQSNKKQMINAITYVIFPGELNRKERERLIDIIESSQLEFFVFLFKEQSTRKIVKSIYTFESSQTILRKIYGDKSPNQITAEMVQVFYKYDNSSKQFKAIDGCRSFSFSINAIDLRK